MNQSTPREGFVQGLKRRLMGGGVAAPSPGAPEEPPTLRDPMDVLDELKAGLRPDYCLYVGPTKTRSIGPDIERLFISALSPLPFVPLDGYKSPLKRLPTEGAEAAAALTLLAKHARLFLFVPTEDSRSVSRVRALKEAGHLWRVIFLMPESGAFGVEDWQAAWQNAGKAAAYAGVELPPYTGGGWLFRYETADQPLRAATFRMIAHPNVEKVTKAIEAVCQEMNPP